MSTEINITKNLTLTTTGTSGAATLVGSTLNIPQYSGGGASGVYASIPLGSGLVYSNIPLGSSNVTLTPSANQMYLMPFTPQNTFTTSSIIINVSGAALSTSSRILIYSHSIATGLPGTKLYESTDLNTGTTGIKTATTSQTFTAGTTYWLGVYSNGSPLFTASSTSGQFIIGCDSFLLTFTSIQASATYGSAPTTFVPSSAGRLNSNFPKIGLIVA
jgi:hypothetical protein